MPQVIIPITTYSVRSVKPNQKYGSPAACPLTSAVSAILARVPLDKVPVDAVISSAVLRVYADRASAGSKNLRVRAITSSWNSSVNWTTRPTNGSVISSTDIVAPAEGQPFDLSVTAWALTRDRKGLWIESTSSPGHWLRGSAGTANQPVLIVDYAIVPDTPGNLAPNGGSVSVASPILTYVGEEDMTQQKIEYSNDGVTPTYSSGFIAATSGYFDPAVAAGAEPVLTNGGAGVYWRATTNGPQGNSLPSEWAYYEYDAFPALTITNPGATSVDGSPPLQWTVASQSAWRAKFLSGDEVIDESGWLDETATRTWTPGKSIPVPGGTGRFELEIRDAITARVASYGLLTTVKASKDFTTTLSGAGTAITTIGVNFVDPIPVITGTRAAGVPDEVALFRDGVAVPIWDPANGDVYPMWAPGASFFVGTAFTFRDYTADLRHAHTWTVRVRIGGVVSAVGPSAAGTFSTRSVWLVNPFTAGQVEVLGYGAQPVVGQTTVEASVLHTPINGGVLVEPKRRRLIRSTRSGTVEGTVLNADEGELLGWVEGDSGVKYRLIFGKVNWPVIIGDYSPVDTFYGDACGPDRVLVGLNWWQRLADI